jgi:hypothetical protein
VKQLVFWFPDLRSNVFEASVQLGYSPFWKNSAEDPTTPGAHTPLQ